MAAGKRKRLSGQRVRLNSLSITIEFTGVGNEPGARVQQNPDARALCVVDRPSWPQLWPKTRAKSRNPKFPASALRSPARLIAEHGKLPESAEENLDTARIQEAIDHCVAGRAVELRADGPNNAFLSGPLELKPSVTLLVAGGAVLFATRNPREYDVQPGSCGTVNQEGRGCKPLIHARNAPHSGVMGEGIH